jgi:hypothetical protein
MGPCYDVQSYATYTLLLHGPMSSDSSLILNVRSYWVGPHGSTTKYMLPLHGPIIFYILNVRSYWMGPLLFIYWIHDHIAWAHTILYIGYVLLLHGPISDLYTIYMLVLHGPIVFLYTGYALLLHGPMVSLYTGFTLLLNGPIIYLYTECMLLLHGPMAHHVFIFEVRGHLCVPSSSVIAKKKGPKGNNV